MALPEPITTESDVHAWRALLAFKADPDQQRRCIEWLGRATMRGSVPYVSGPDGERDTLVLLGGQRIGVMIGNMITPEALGRAKAADYERANPRPALAQKPAPKRHNRREPK